MCVSVQTQGRLTFLKQASFSCWWWCNLQSHSSLSDCPLADDGRYPLRALYSKFCPVSFIFLLSVNEALLQKAPCMMLFCVPQNWIWVNGWFHNPYKKLQYMHRFNRIFNNPTASPINHTFEKRWSSKVGEKDKTYSSQGYGKCKTAQESAAIIIFELLLID